MTIESPLREKHEQAGAAMGVWFGAALPAGYGDFDSEYRSARDAVAVVDTNFQLLAELTGPDRVRYLNAITTASILDLEPGRSAIGLLLDSHAHILAELRTLALPDRLTVLSHAMARERTLATLDRFIIMDDVTLTDRSGEFGSLALVGPGALALARELTNLDLDAIGEGGHAEARVGAIACRVLRACSLGLPGVEWIVGREQLCELWELLARSAARHGGGRAGYRAIEALRLEAGLPWFGADFDEHSIPHEAGLEQTHISYTKGCYTGQEIVERVRSRGHVNRRLIGLAFTGAAIPGPGEPLSAGGATVGQVTSAAFSPAAGRVLGLAYLRREFQAPGSRVTWAGGEAEAIALPLAPSSPL
ncbi:MAG TPA: glycine cleavage T C-terminal barrel domain-containing protein [Candidatus Dormibacteraeota bacterium]|nr:glycine cleavage T C-terminal barrel domain-containing protein [Candidatus Dormibacteraeota bacterium]